MLGAPLPPATPLEQAMAALSPQDKLITVRTWAAIHTTAAKKFKAFPKGLKAYL